MKDRSLRVLVVGEEEATKASMIYDYFEAFHYWVSAMTDQHGNKKYFGGKSTFNEAPANI